MTIARPAMRGPGVQGGRFEVVPADAALGAEVCGLDLRALDDATFKTLHEAWLHHIVLVFRGQKLTAEDLVVLVRRFGTPVTSSNLHKRKLEGRTGTTARRCTGAMRSTRTAAASSTPRRWRATGRSRRPMP